MVGWLNTVTIENLHSDTTVALRMNNLSGDAADLKLYAYGIDGKLMEVPKQLWSIKLENGEIASTLSADILYEVHIAMTDGCDFDLSETAKEIQLCVVLGK